MYAYLKNEDVKNQQAAMKKAQSLESEIQATIEKAHEAVKLHVKISAPTVSASHENQLMYSSATNVSIQAYLHFLYKAVKVLKRNMKFYWPLSAIKRKGPFQKSRRRVGNKKSAGRLATLPSVPAPSPDLPAAIQEVVSDPETPLTPTDEPPITPLVPVPAPDQEPQKNVQPPLATGTHSLLIPDPGTPPPTPLAPKQAVRRKHKGWVYVDDSDPRDTPNEEACHKLTVMLEGFGSANLRVKKISSRGDEFSRSCEC
ncbi:hypothetical protein P5673_026956 [Acropora cervicornis]|uniref:Uncharacterized protein n=1 Tax=Acropora cervicornis TaxID=6130 RepID=A0AAD9UWA9_ACRCE|nr:hypothetical protein P5673_026956 [Acropora cervicornis]